MDRTSLSRPAGERAPTRDGWVVGMGIDRKGARRRLVEQAFAHLAMPPAGPRFVGSLALLTEPDSESLFKRPSSRAKSSTCSKPLYTLAKRTAATSSSRRRPSRTARPTCSLCTSGPSDQAVCSTAAAKASSCSGSTGRSCHVARTPAITLRRSNDSRRPERFTTTAPPGWRVRCS